MAGAQLGAIWFFAWPAAASQARRARRTICGGLPGAWDQASEFGPLFGREVERPFGASHAWKLALLRSLSKILGETRR